MPKLTDRSLRALPLPDGKGARDYPDHVMVGLSLTVQPSGVRSWCYRYRFAGTQKRFTIGRYPALGLVAARKRARGLQEQIDAGVDPQAEKLAMRSGEVVDAYPELAAKFVETYHMPRNRSWQEQARVLGLSLDKAQRRFAMKRLPVKPKWEPIAGSPAERWGKRTVGSITRRDIAELVGSVATNKPLAANKLRVVLGRFFGWLVEQGVLEQSPVAGTRPPSPTRSGDRVLSGKEIALVWQAAGSLGPPFGSFVRLLILTAARRNEVADMRAGELDGSMWTIPAERVKNGREHELPLPQAAMTILEKLKSTRAGFLFSTNLTTPISGFSKMKRQLDAAVTKLNGGKPLAEWKLHDIRRSVSTGMGDLGVDPHVIEKVLNHTVIIAGVAATYNKAAYRAEKAAALERWAQHVFECWQDAKARSLFAAA